jgi:predicted alpha/beta-fold hydrolase
MKTKHAITKALMPFAAIFLLSIPLVSLAADQPKVDNEPHMVKLADAEIEYFSQGQGDVVVLLPGGGLNVSYMEGLAQSLSKAGYRAVRINSRGAGTSKSAVDNVTLHDLAGDVQELLKPWISGRSM